MPLKILADTHIAKQISLQLRVKGVDIIRLEEVPDLGNDATDLEILEYAIIHDRAVLSLDNDFPLLHYEFRGKEREHRGIFWGSRKLQGQIGIIVNFINEYHEAFENDDDIYNQLIEIEVPNA